MESHSDETLLAEHLAKKPGAFDILVQRYKDELFRFLLRFVGSAAAADDLVQEAFLQVHLSAATFDPARSFKPWLYTIASNKARDWLRSRVRRQETSLDHLTGADGDAGGGPSDLLPADGGDAWEDLAEAEQRRRVQQVIGGMPEHLRLILTLGYYQQLPYAEIAEILEIPVGTVKSRLHSAVTHFARAWSAQTAERDV